MKNSLLFLLTFFILPLHADDALFFGNSYTQGTLGLGVQDHGGVPQLVASIAKAKGKTLSTQMIVPGGKNWKFHLDQGGTSSALAEKKWNWVVLQDQSAEPTHIGNVRTFQETGLTFYTKIRELAPQATVILYETWARGKGSDLYASLSSPQTFSNPSEMTSELVQNYTGLEKTLEAIEPGPQVQLAPVGAAFARSLELNPEINLYAGDLHHASAEGYYLAALVLYATLYQDSPLGATNQFPGITIDPAKAAKLQKVAEEVAGSLIPPKS